MAMIEIPLKFAGRPPVNPEARKNKELIARKWKGAQGLAEDVRYYGTSAASSPSSPGCGRGR